MVFWSWYYPIRPGLVGAWHRSAGHTWWGSRNPPKHTDSFAPDNTRSFKSSHHSGIKPARVLLQGIFTGVDSSTHRLRDSWSQAMPPPMSTAVQAIPWHNIDIDLGRKKGNFLKFSINSSSLDMSKLLRYELTQFITYMRISIGEIKEWQIIPCPRMFRFPSSFWGKSVHKVSPTTDR